MPQGHTRVTLNQSDVHHDVIARAYRAHPLLAPDLGGREHAAARLWLPAYRALRRAPDDDWLHRRFLRVTLGGDQTPAQAPGAYFEDVERYLDDLLRMASDEVAHRLRPLQEIRDLNRLAPLLRTTFTGDTPRLRYEARRKLYLTKLLFDIDHTRAVRDGRRHRELVERHLQDVLWGDRSGGQVREVCVELPSHGHQMTRWCFRVRHVRPDTAKAPIEVFEYRTRFKREVDMSVGDAGDGRLKITEAARWPALGRRSGSILGKMIRRGLGDANAVPDLLGALFVVADRRQAYLLERHLVTALGGPFGGRDRVDALSPSADRSGLNATSAPAFCVLKQMVDVLMADPASHAPYQVPVEMQIYPLEAYLDTLSGEGLAGHRAYKRRQFLSELLPILFPPSIYGDASP